MDEEKPIIDASTIDKRVAQAVPTKLDPLIKDPATGAATLGHLSGSDIATGVLGIAARNVGAHMIKQGVCGEAARNANPGNEATCLDMAVRDSMFSYVHEMPNVGAGAELAVGGGCNLGLGSNLLPDSTPLSGKGCSAGVSFRMKF